MSGFLKPSSQPFFGVSGLSTSQVASSLDREQESESDLSQVVPSNPLRQFSLAEQRVHLPIFEQRGAILYCIENYQTTVIVGETGCGKTTQLPQYLLEAGWASPARPVVITQPRRVAAISVASRVAKERGSLLGGEVGYAVRFDAKHGPQTAIRFATDGILLRETLSDPLLTAYGAVMIDEAHERSLTTDILLGLLKKILRKRPDLKLIVSSATLDAEMFREFFNYNETEDPRHDTAIAMSVEGRMYPVDLLYAEHPVSDYLRATVDTILRIHEREPPGDILAFLTGQEEVDSATQLLKDSTATSKTGRFLHVLPLYASLPPDRQLKIFDAAPPRHRKVVIATNIAEASVTVPGVAYVVDSGFAKYRVYDPAVAMDALVVQPISQASAIQRAGRAGRVRSGKCFRLYTERDFLALSPQTKPELQRANLSPVCLTLKALGIDYLLHFEFPSPPSVEAMMRALEHLYALGALSDHGRLTSPLGARMAEMPVEPMMAKSLLVSADYGCSEEILSIAAMLSVQNVFHCRDPRRLNGARRRFSVAEGDQITLLNVYRQWERRSAKHSAKQVGQWMAQFCIHPRALARAVEIRRQLKRMFKRFRIPLVSCGASVTPVQRCLCAGFFANAAVRCPDGLYRTVRDQVPVDIHPSSTVFQYPPPCFVFHDVTYTTKRFARDVCAIEAPWLVELAPHYYATRTPSAVAGRVHPRETSLAAGGPRKRLGPAPSASGIEGLFRSLFQEGS